MTWTVVDEDEAEDGLLPTPQAADAWDWGDATAVDRWVAGKQVMLSHVVNSLALPDDAPDPVEPGTQRWAELVAGGIAIVAERNFFLGDAALEIAPVGRSGVRNGRNAALARFADEVDVNAGSLAAYRKVAYAWPAGTRVPATPWKVHQVLMRRPDLVRPGMTVAEARRALGQPDPTPAEPRPAADVTRIVATCKGIASDIDVWLRKVDDGLTDAERQALARAVEQAERALASLRDRISD